jgi:hypothetical protein
VRNELAQHLKQVAGGIDQAVELANVGEIELGDNGDNGRGPVVLTVVNVLEERTLKNLPNHVRDDAALRVSYQNPPVFLNLAVLVAATHTTYSQALVALSRAIAFFQYRNVFTQDTVAPASLTTDAPVSEADQLEEFKLVFNLTSPTIEEVNYLWGTLGGRQYPFALYSVRMLEMRFVAAQGDSGLITEVLTTVGGR